MAESTLQKLTRNFTGAVIPPFQREALLRLFPSERIGDEGVKTWAKRILKKLGEAKMQAAGGDWMPGEDKFDITSIDIVPYDVQKRVTMNRSEVRVFERNGVMPVGFDELGSVMAKKANQLLFTGKDTTKGDQYNKTNNQYVTKVTPTSTDYADPTIIDGATNGVWDTAGQVQLDAADLCGNLERYGYNVATSVLFYPEVCAPIMRRPAINGTGIYSDRPLLETFMDQGIMGSVAVKDSYLLTAAATLPTVEDFDIYLIDLSQILIGYTIPENTEVIYDAYSKNTALDAQIAFTPLFLPREFDDANGYVYKGVSRINSIDANT